MFPIQQFVNEMFPVDMFPHGSVLVFKNWTARDGIRVVDLKYSGQRSSFEWTREKDVVKIQEVNNSWDTETGKLPPR